MGLLSMKSDVYSGDYNTAVLEQWKTCVEMANSTTEKRNNSNSIFITVNSALFAVYTFSSDFKGIPISIVGIAVCILWLLSIKSYKQLSSVKYHIINEIEKQLPLAPFDYEWEKLKSESHYKGLITFERILPWIFIAVYIITILWPFHDMIQAVLC